MSTMNATIIRAKEQLLREKIIKSLDDASTLINRAQIMGAWNSTSTHATWKRLEEARKAIDAANEMVACRSDEYEDQAGELLPAMPRGRKEPTA